MSEFWAKVATVIEAWFVTPVGVEVEVISVVAPLVESWVDNVVTLSYPNDFLGWVVEIEFNLNVVSNNCFVTLELKLFNKVFVGDLSETTTLISVKVDVVNKECY